MRTTKLHIAALAAGSLALAMTAQANLVTNGSFEDPALAPGTWININSIPGWSAGGAANLEVGRGTVYGISGFDGNNVMELDSTDSVIAVSTQVNTVAGTTYTLSFLYSNRTRSGVEAVPDPEFEVWWNGTLLDTITASGLAMQAASYQVDALGNDIITFRGLPLDPSAPASDSYGAVIDNVAVVPEPSTYFAAALLGLPFVASVARRRMAKVA